MKNNTAFSFLPEERPLSKEGLENRLGVCLAQQLSTALADISPEVSAGLQRAHQQALAQFYLNTRTPTKKTGWFASTQANGQAVLHGWGAVLGQWLGSILPILVLLVGLVYLDKTQEDKHARELAELDMALLSDTLPAQAYTDPGFAQYLAQSPQQHYEPAQ